MSFDYDSLIYDRTITDVNSGTNKGHYNIEDLNRVESCCKDLAEKLNGYNYHVDIITKTDWTMEEVPRFNDTDRIINNIASLKEAYFTLSTTPQVPESTRILTHEDANAMEKILKDIHFLMNGMLQNYIYGGVCRGGQPRIWQQRFRRPRYWGGLQFDNISESTNDITLGNISVLNDEANFPIDKYSSVYGTAKALNNSYIYLDEMVGGLNG